MFMYFVPLSIICQLEKSFQYRDSHPDILCERHVCQPPTLYQSYSVVAFNHAVLTITSQNPSLGIIGHCTGSMYFVNGHALFMSWCTTSDTGTRTLVSCVKGKYANHLHHIGVNFDCEWATLTTSEIQ